VSFFVHPLRTPSLLAAVLLAYGAGLAIAITQAGAHDLDPVLGILVGWAWTMTGLVSAALVVRSDG